MAIVLRLIDFIIIHINFMQFRYSRHSTNSVFPFVLFTFIPFAFIPSHHLFATYWMSVIKSAIIATLLAYIMISPLYIPGPKHLFMNIINSKGDRTSPCLTPDCILIQSLSMPCVRTLLVVFAYILLIALTNLFGIL